MLRTFFRVIIINGALLIALLGANSASIAAQAQDITPPRIQSITRHDPVGEFTNSTTMIWDVAFSEDVTGVSLSQDFVISATVGLVSGVPSASQQEISPQLYRMTLNPTFIGESGNVSLVLGSNPAFEDSSGNAMTDFVIAGAHERYIYDAVSPSLNITSTEGLPTSDTQFPLTFTFSEPVTGFGVSDLALTTGVGTFSNFSGSGAVYTADLNLTSEGPFGVTVADSASVDRAGNQSDGATFDGTSDFTVPGATMTALPTTVNGPFDVTVTFDEDVTGFVVGNFSVTNGTTANLQVISAQQYSATVTPTADGTVSVLVLANAANDLAGNANTASGTVSTTADVTRPTVAFDVPAGPVNVPFTLTLEFSEPISGLSLSDLNIGNGGAANLQQSSTTVYTATITPASDGAVTVDLPANAVVDGFGLGNVAATTASTVADLTDPEPTLAATPDFPGTPYTVTISFDETVSGLDLGDFTTSNVDLTSLSGSGDTYTMQATGTDFAQSIQLNAATVLDTAGNPNIASNIIAVTPDGGSPTLTISGMPAEFVPGDTFDATFTFSEDVIGFTAADITISNASLSALTGGPSVYTGSVTPDNRGDVGISVAIGAAHDITGEPSAAASAVAAINTSDAQSEIIATFLQARARSLIQNQPSVTRFLTGGTSGSGAINATRDAGTFSLMSRGEGPLWMAASGSWTESDTEDLSYGLVVFGYHKEIASGTIVGAMLQYDVANQEDEIGNTVEGTGWLVGPYFASRVGEQQLFVDGRILFGKSDNEITLSTDQTGNFSGDRMLATLGAQGRFETEQGWTLIPNLAISHVSDAQDSYVSDGSLVPAQSVSLTEVDMGVDFEIPISVSQGDMILDMGISGIYGRTNGSGAASAYITEEESSRGRIDIGLRYDNGNGLTSFGSGFADGLGGDSNGTTYGLTLGFSLAL